MVTVKAWRRGTPDDQILFVWEMEHPPVVGDYLVPVEGDTEYLVSLRVWESPTILVVTVD